MMINIPCPSCGCQFFEAKNNSGEKCSIEVCRCNDGSGEFEVSITPVDRGEIQYEKHQCLESDIANCLSSRFNIDFTTIKHQCY